MPMEDRVCDGVRLERVVDPSIRQAIQGKRLLDADASAGSVLKQVENGRLRRPL